MSRVRVLRVDEYLAHESFRIIICISDPWELGEALKWQPLQGELLRMTSDEGGGRALIKLDAALSYRGSTWHYVIAAPRHQGNEMAELQTGKKVPAALTGIPDQQAESSRVLDTRNWRGGLAFLGDVEPVTDESLPTTCGGQS